MNVLLSPCHVSSHDAPQDRQEFTAIWDTGAERSCITERVVQECGLQPIGQLYLEHAGTSDKPDRTDVYLVDVFLPNQVKMMAVQASRVSIKNADVLIGMDIINIGDFAVSHPDGKTQFSFQVPSEANIDFVVPPNRQERRLQERLQRRSPKRK